MKLKRNKTILIVVLIIILGLVFYYYFKDEKVYIDKEYSASGKLIGINEYVIRSRNPVMHGKFINYNEKGIKIAEGQFIDGEVKGKCIYYYDDGKLESKVFRKNTKITEESYEYYQNGNIKRYVIYDPFGARAFTVLYDEQGSLKSAIGYPLMEVYQHLIANKDKFKVKTNQYLKVGDYLKYKYLIANIPKTKRNFSVETLEPKMPKTKRTMKRISTTQVDYEEVLYKKGINTIRAIVEYKFDNKEKTIIKDTITFSVDVH